MVALRTLLLAPLIATLVACGASDPSGAGAGPLPTECKTLLDGLWLCAARLPTGARESLLEVIDTQRKSWTDVARQRGPAPAALDTGCREVLEQVRGSTRELCAGIAWGVTPPTPPALPTLPTTAAPAPMAVPTPAPGGPPTTPDASTP